MKHVIKSNSPEATFNIGAMVGQKLEGGEVIELIGDLGAGKTIFVRGLAAGIKSSDKVQSPSFTIVRVYKGPKIELHHFDFYRLDNVGILTEQLAEILENPQAAVVLEWSQIVSKLLPKERLSVHFETRSISSRLITISTFGKSYQNLTKDLKLFHNIDKIANTNNN